MQVLAPLLRSCSGEKGAAAAIFVPRCTSSGAFQEVQCGRVECWCVDPQGQEVSGTRTTRYPPRCPSLCERQRALALKVKANMAAGAEIYIPACSEDGDILPLQCVGSRCFCVDAEGKTSGPAGDAVTCKTSHSNTRFYTLYLLRFTRRSSPIGSTGHNLMWGGAKVCPGRMSTGTRPEHDGGLCVCCVSGPDRRTRSSSAGQMKYY